jgi:uncharacterized protein YcsI (UPF0317 family)
MDKEGLRMYDESKEGNQLQQEELDVAPLNNWFGAPRLSSPRSQEVPRAFRHEVRAGRFTGPTNAQCPGFLQCNLVVLPQGPYAYDFLLFCQRNPQACPLLDVCDVGSPHPVGLALDADVRTDCPM